MDPSRIASIVRLAPSFNDIRAFHHARPTSLLFLCRSVFDLLSVICLGFPAPAAIMSLDVRFCIRFSPHNHALLWIDPRRGGSILKVQRSQARRVVGHRTLSVMSQQQLDYSAVAIHTRRFLWRRRIIAIAVFVCSLAVTPVAIKAAWLSAGAGEGDYFWFRALFPGPIWAARIANHDLSGFVDTLMRLQFPVYGLIIAVSLCAGRRWWIAGLATVAAIHGVPLALNASAA